MHIIWFVKLFVRKNLDVQLIHKQTLLARINLDYFCLCKFLYCCMYIIQIDFVQKIN